MFELLPILKQRFFDDNGDPLAGGKLYSYIAGTSTPSGTYTDSSGSTPNTNPIILDADGYADVWISVGGGSYKFVLTDSDDIVQFTVDNVSQSAADVPSGWAEHDVVDGQSATTLTGETLNLALYSGAIYDCQIVRGTTVASSGPVWVENLNSVGRVTIGVFSGEHGVTFTVSQVALVVTLKAALDFGAGDGQIKLSRRLVPA